VKSFLTNSLAGGTNAAKLPQVRRAEGSQRVMRGPLHAGMQTPACSETPEGRFHNCPPQDAHSPEALASVIIEVISNLRQFEMTLVNPGPELGDSREKGRTR
jgi:hypothetical protein